MELFSAIQRENQRKNFEEQVAPLMEKATKVSDASVKDIMAILAAHGGRLEVQGFGAFYIHEVPGHMSGEGTHKRYKPGRRHVSFRACQQFRDMLNQDYFGAQDEPMPNSDYWKGAKNLYI